MMAPPNLTLVKVIDIGFHFLHTLLHVVKWSQTNITCNQEQRGFKPISPKAKAEVSKH